MRDIDVEFMVSSSNSLPCSSLPRNVANSWINGIRRVSVDGWTSKVREDRIQETPDADHHMKIACKKEECRACALAGTLGVLDRFLASQTNKMSKRPRSLTFRGKLGMRTQVMDRAAGDLEHRFIGAHGLAASTPQTFEVNMHWQYWDMAILSVFPMSQLSVLKVPIGIPADCEQLGRALVTMPLLKSLTIRDMADHPHFLKNYPFLGLGIRSRSATLKDLDLSMTNHNRPNFYDAWEHTVENERFVKPATLNYFFSAIFPLSMDDIHVNARQRYMKFEEQIKKKMSRPEDCTRLLSLAKLHLKRIDLPAWSFEKVLDGTNLKELRLQYCDVDKDVWPSIGSRMLVALENIDYELLRCKTFRHFLYSQSHLQSLSFARPPDQYRAAYLVFWTRDEVPTLLMELESQAPPLSQAWAMVSDANSGYPTSETFLNTLSKANIRNLLLPVDMYCISPNDIRGIGAFLPFLQQLTWGFDYGNPVRLLFGPAILTATKMLMIHHRRYIMLSSKISYPAFHPPYAKSRSSHSTFRRATMDLTATNSSSTPRIFTK